VIAVKRLVAVAVLAAFGAAPVLADRCATSCEAARQAGEPACHHHAAPASAHFSPQPVPCGYDHQPSIADDARVNAPASLRPAVRAVAVAAAGTTATGGTYRSWSIRPPARSPSPSFPLTLTVTLRI
jgi:hypothetical protein